MQPALFDLALEGTAVQDCLRHQHEALASAIVFDANDTYGSTCCGFQGLERSKYVQNAVLHRGTDSRILIEALPHLIRPSDESIPRIEQTGMMGFIQFIRIESHFYIDASGKAHRIPCTKTDIADSSFLSLKEKILFNRLLKGKTVIEELVQALSTESRRILVEGVMCSTEMQPDILRRYVQNFGDVPFIYPKHGLKDISEAFARSNSMCGTAHVLDSSLRILDREDCEETIPEEYRYRIDTRYGVVFAKDVVRSTLSSSKSHIRVVNSTQELLGKTFFAAARRAEIMKIIGLNSDTECCPEGTYLFYIIKEHSCVTDGDLQFLGMHPESITHDISYESRFRFSFDCI